MRNGHLDDVDRHIISVLQANARVPISSLARKVDLSRNAVQERIRRLERQGAIMGYTVRLGRGHVEPGVKAYMLLYLEGPICERILPSIERIPNIKLSQSLSGEIDMIVYVYAESLSELNRVRDELERIRGVRRVVTAPVLAERFDRRQEIVEKR